MRDEPIRQIDPLDFKKLDWSKITILDLREPREINRKDEFPGAINLPFAEIFTGLDDVPRDKAVYVICAVGDWSAEVTEIMQDRGYDAYNVKGGYEAYTKINDIKG